MNTGHNSGDEDIPERKSEYETQSLLNAHSNMKLHQRYSGHISAKELQLALSSTFGSQIIKKAEHQIHQNTVAAQQQTSLNSDILKKSDIMKNSIGGLFP